MEVEGKKRLCPHCGASMMEYKHGLSTGLVAGLVKLYRHRKPVNIKVLGLTRNQWDNFQKLRYWELVRKYTPPGERPKGKGGVWTITQYGIDFVEMRTSAPKFVWTYRGERMRYEGDPVFIKEVDALYRVKPDYSADAVPHEDEQGQLEFW